MIIRGSASQPPEEAAPIAESGSWYAHGPWGQACYTLSCVPGWKAAISPSVWGDRFTGTRTMAWGLPGSSAAYRVTKEIPGRQFSECWPVAHAARLPNGDGIVMLDMQPAPVPESPLLSFALEDTRLAGRPREYFGLRKESSYAREMGTAKELNTAVFMKKMVSVYRFKTERTGFELRLVSVGELRDDHGSCLCVCCT
jgi:hypothetical protein